MLAVILFSFCFAKENNAYQGDSKPLYAPFSLDEWGREKSAE
jgi:hypothetical protein